MSGVQTREVVEDEDGIRLDRWFGRHFPHLSFAQVQKLVRTGQVRVDGKRAKAAQRLVTGQTVRVPPVSDIPQRKTPVVSAQDKDFIRSLVIYEDDHVIALNKPPGIAVQGGSKVTRHIDGLLSALEKNGEQPRLAHRLDRDTSGVLLLARTAKVAASLGKSFQGRNVRKYYTAVTFGVPEFEKGTIDAPLAKLEIEGEGRVVVDEEVGKSAKTHYTVLDKAGKGAALVAFWPVTGRTHQIRVHAALIDAPILGDNKYGGDEDSVQSISTGKGLHLHASRLVLPHPGGRKKMLDISAPLSPEILKTIKVFGFHLSGMDDPFEGVE